MKHHVNVPIFIPHLGCPNQCVFCNQRTISGVTEFNISLVTEQIETALSTVGGDTTAEIAFFGGSFTGIDRSLMIQLLEITDGYVKAGRVESVRCSTRPDYISAEILDILEKYNVKTIELGLQSIDDGVLSVAKRGHDSACATAACKMIVERGFSLVGQMMIGLPAATSESELETADFIINSGAVGARIYPTVVFHQTELADMSRFGVYTPLTVEEAVVRSAAVMRKFIDAGVDVIRVGLCASENLAGEDTYLAGPNHPAIGELVENEIFYGLIKDEINKINIKSNSKITVSVPRGSLSKAIGQKRKNKLRLLKEFSISYIAFEENEQLFDYSIAVREER
ncbi:MAG: radical SAM protein [Clostridia bacterium]|nr:radical SAM protein [Clostridia bacterium]